MDVKKLNSIYQAAHKMSVRELVIETKSTKVQMLLPPYVKKKGSTGSNGDKATSVAVVETQADTKDETPKFDILSSQIGFFSRYNAKTKRQYVKLRDQVKKGDVVASIRSMHLIYDIVADRPGKIVEFLVEEGQPVEYHQPIIRLIPITS